jgi:hypothetical protein
MRYSSQYFLSSSDFYDELSWLCVYDGFGLDDTKFAIFFFVR